MVVKNDVTKSILYCEKVSFTAYLHYNLTNRIKIQTILPNKGYCICPWNLFAERVKLGIGEVERGAPYLLVPTALPGHNDEMLPINRLLTNSLLNLENNDGSRKILQIFTFVSAEHLKNADLKLWGRTSKKNILSPEDAWKSAISTFCLSLSFNIVNRPRINTVALFSLLFG